MDYVYSSAFSAVLPRNNNTHENISITTNTICFSDQELEEICYKKQNSSKTQRSGEDLFEVFSLDNYINSKTSEDINFWRNNSKQMKNKFMLQQELFTDCTFIIGPENNTKTIKAHKVILQRSSPLFESMFAKYSSGRPIRIPDVTPQAFKALLEFVYTDNTCFDSFENSCELMKLAMKFELPKLIKYTRANLWSSLYPGNIWKIHECTSDTSLKETALQIAQWKTEESIQDFSFLDVTHNTLIQFLSQDNLNINSEIELLNASINWAIAKSQRENLNSSDIETLHNLLGPALSLIRFLTLTPKEFSENLDLTSKILSCNESLTILLNLNSPGILPLPSNISDNKISRSTTVNNNKYIDVLIPLMNSCNNKNNMINGKNTFELFTTRIKAVQNSRTIRGFFIPSQIITNTTENLSYFENITIYLMNSKTNAIESENNFNGQVKYNSLIFVRIKQPASLYTCSDINSCQYIRVRPNVEGRYPNMVPSKYSPGKLNNEYVKDINSSTYVLYLDGFVHSIVL